ncbi:hypothetical protein [Nocardioides aurantiacus]|uniref:Type VII secretion system (Wss) protein ESAT-6 n=1 Tax=Nocardioides aurantiacus TaxID=86796 RepID=A0A3N2CUL3_9ACTN|nr:hypothetical protein [Nocardioides aurantiacus]ROR91227.1 hypothetical protein EDD33_2093 [Nocardioides aurantiacus]
MTITLTHRSPDLYAAEMSGAEGELIESLRDKCGIVIGAIDWVARKVGFDLIGSIFDPIAGGFGTVDSMAASWATTGRALEDIAANYEQMVQQIPGGWTGDAAEACCANLAAVAEAHGVQGEACVLMAQQLQSMLEATRVTCELIAETLSLVDEIVLSFGVTKLLKEVVTGGATIRRVATLLMKAIDYVQDLQKLIPNLLRAAALLSSMLKALHLSFSFAAGATEYSNAQQVDEVAEAGAG